MDLGSTSQRPVLWLVGADEDGLSTAIFQRATDQGWLVVGTQPTQVGAQNSDFLHFDPVLEPQSAERAVSTIVERYGRLDGLVHCHWTMVRGGLIDSSPAALHDGFMANAKEAFLCTQAVGRYFIEHPPGSIVYVVSIHDEKPSGASLSFSMAESAIAMLAKEAALTLGRHQVRVNVIEWGAQAGDDRRFFSAVSALYDDYQSKVPSRRLGRPEDLANVVGFLLSAKSAHIHGATIRVDGGFLLHYVDEKMRPVGSVDVDSDSDRPS